MMMNWCWAVFLMLALFGGKSRGNTEDISGSLQCEPPSNEKIECQFNLYNNGDGTILVSKWLTPLEGIQSSCLQVTRNGKNVPYDGIMIYRTFPPPSSSYVQISPERKVSMNFDLSETYSINEPGEYTVSVYIRNLYVYTGSLDKENSTKLSLKSPEVTFAITEKVHVRQTIGEKKRRTRETRATPHSHSRRGKGPLTPLFTRVFDQEDAKRKHLITQVHRAAYHYLNATALEVMENEDHFKTWFGDNLTNREIVRENYVKILRHLEQTVITYELSGFFCYFGRSTAYTFRFSNKITLCDTVFHYKALVPDDTLVSIVSLLVHELTHSVNGFDDIAYGKSTCQDLAKTNASKAIRNADNYEFFTSTTYPFNFGIDAMAVFPSGYTYIVKGNFYARLGKGENDPFTLETRSYPKLIDGNWRKLPDEFVNGFDSMFNCKDPKYTYVTKGSWYVRYTNNTLDTGYPQRIKYHFRNLQQKFKDGFNSGAHLPGAYTYITKGKHFIGFRDSECRLPTRVAQISRYWGNITRAFKKGFDSMMTTVSGKTFVTKGKQYIRYSDKWGRVVDAGYPKDIRGNFGKLKE